jgi:hypothetical protein
MMAVGYGKLSGIAKIFLALFASLNRSPENRNSAVPE